MKYSEKRILITGGSRGIGLALFHELRKRGARHFAILARKIGPIHELTKEFPELDILPVACDLGSPVSINNAVLHLSKDWGKLDILINNAGVVSAGDLEKLSDEDIVQQVNINLTGLILLTKKCLPFLKESKEAAIINVSSGLGYIAWPFYSVYAATKAGVRQFSDAMRRDLINYPIHIMTVYPTTTDTPMMKNARVQGKMDSPDMVARRSIEGLENRELNVIFGGEQRLEDIHTNFHEPEKIDEKARERYEALRQRTEKHRAM
jgi:short-subunit dehydrogenase